jgi:hypothetical protein
MSGGSYDYAFHKIADLADAIHVKGGCGEDYAAPESLRRAFKAHLHKVAAACRAIEWNDSGDGDQRETELIRACLSPGAELEQATADAREALEALRRAVVAVERGVMK